MVRTSVWSVLEWKRTRFVIQKYPGNAEVSSVSVCRWRTSLLFNSYFLRWSTQHENNICSHIIFERDLALVIRGSFQGNRTTNSKSTFATIALYALYVVDLCSRIWDVRWSGTARALIPITGFCERRLINKCCKRSYPEDVFFLVSKPRISQNIRNSKWWKGLSDVSHWWLADGRERDERGASNQLILIILISFYLSRLQFGSMIYCLTVDSHQVDRFKNSTARQNRVHPSKKTFWSYETWVLRKELERPAISQIALGLYLRSTWRWCSSVKT